MLLSHVSRRSWVGRPMSLSYMALSRASANDIASTRTPRTSTTTKTACIVSCFWPTTLAPTHSANNGAPVQMLTARKAVAALRATRLKRTDRIEGAPM